MKLPLLIVMCCSIAVSSAARRNSGKNLTAAEREFSDFSSQLFAADVNSMAKFIVLNLQTKAGKNSDDKAPQPLFVDVPFAKMKTLPTYASLLAMYDNYEAAVDKAEVVTRTEQAEEERFLDAVMATDVMKKTHRFLVSKGKADPDSARFRQYLKDIWFGLYSRARGVSGSSGFEHVFLGELKNGVSGLHSWIRYSLEEKAGIMNYLGYLSTVKLGDDVLLELPIYWRNVFKQISSILIGVSPELEMALYTACFALQPNSRCLAQVGGNSFHIQTHTIDFHGKTYIGSVYPTL